MTKKKKLNPTTLKLKKYDAAIVVRQDGTPELYIPAQPDDDEVYDNTVVIALMMLILKDKKTRDFAQKRFQAVLRAASREEKKART